MVVGKEGLWDRKQSKKGKGGEICMIFGGVRSMTVSLCHSFVIPVVLHWPKVINNSSNLFTLIATETQAKAYPFSFVEIHGMEQMIIQWIHANPLFCKLQIL